MTEVDIEDQLRRWREGVDPPLWQGAVPDMWKLTASIQVDQYGLWWRDSKCSKCEEEASYLGPEGYLCDEHRDHIEAKKQ